ncbi:hypothetical protein [Microbispora sp. ATCC PTA-5024]|uniref:hypothetical protein n=1 Tax=Microbispora sp. ATCC PTA-5024 TaxID=316330 RepID=UPI0003DB89FE|nr:hypothetical protein [Microbispora sp. ATCC PTA-5024]ETK35844.1 hypothetical protein MPTA5024_12035 [Microbispora sp. ATCC PTA-5024]
MAGLGIVLAVVSGDRSPAAVTVSAGPHSPSVGVLGEDATAAPRPSRRDMGTTATPAPGDTARPTPAVSPTPPARAVPTPIPVIGRDDHTGVTAPRGHSSLTGGGTPKARRSPAAHRARPRPVTDQTPPAEDSTLADDDPASGAPTDRTAKREAAPAPPPDLPEQATAPPARIADPCARYAIGDPRRDYCYQMLDQLMGG